MWKYKDFKFENVRKVFRGHLFGAVIGGVLGYFAYTNFSDNFIFAVTPLEKAVSYTNLITPDLIVITSLMVALGAFIGAFIQAGGKY